MLAQTLRPGLIAFVTVDDGISMAAAIIVKAISYLFVINHSVNGVVNQKKQPRQWLEKGKLQVYGRIAKRSKDACWVNEKLMDIQITNQEET